MTFVDQPSWVRDRVAVLRDDPESLAKLIAQHETPPVDEATEVYAQMLDAKQRHYDAQQLRYGDVDGNNKRAIAILRDHLAKVRGE